MAHMDHCPLPGLAVVQSNNNTQAAETHLANAVVALDINPNTANPSIADIRYAIQNQFGSKAFPLAIRHFRSNFVIHFATPQERDHVASSVVLQGKDFDTLLVTWSNRYGGKIIKWDTAVAIDIDGFPPHTFDPSALAPLLEHHCSIQTYRFSEPRGACRVDAYALNTRSIPKSGNIAVQYPDVDGVCNVAFPVTMAAYNYFEAPEFPGPNFTDNPVDSDPADSVASFDTAEELGYDREVLQEAYACQHKANQRLEHGYGPDSGYSCNDQDSDSNDELFYVTKDYSTASSFESDRSCRFCKFY